MGRRMTVGFSKSKIIIQTLPSKFNEDRVLSVAKCRPMIMIVVSLEIGYTAYADIRGGSSGSGAKRLWGVEVV